MSEFPPESLRRSISAIASILKQRNETVAVAETAAGGLISASLLSTPGASAYYRGGLTIYSLESRKVYAGWTEDDVKSYGGPTPDVVANIAQRIQRDLSATYCICESGVAGPTGGRNKPPGYVALAIASANTVTTKEVETGLSNREDNMVRFAGEAFKFFLDVLSDTSSEN